MPSPPRRVVTSRYLSLTKVPQIDRKVATEISRLLIICSMTILLMTMGSLPTLISELCGTCLISTPHICLYLPPIRLDSTSIMWHIDAILQRQARTRRSSSTFNYLHGISMKHSLLTIFLHICLFALAINGCDRANNRINRLAIECGITEYPGETDRIIRFKLNGELISREDLRSATIGSSDITSRVTAKGCIVLYSSDKGDFAHIHKDKRHA